MNRKNGNPSHTRNGVWRLSAASVLEVLQAPRAERGGRHARSPWDAQRSARLVPVRTSSGLHCYGVSCAGSSSKAGGVSWMTWAAKRISTHRS